MVLFVIGLIFTFYILRAMVRLWHEPDNAHWVGPYEIEPEDLELEPELHPLPPTADGKQQQQESGNKDAAAAADMIVSKKAADESNVRPYCHFWNKKCGFDGPPQLFFSCCGQLPSDMAKPPTMEDSRDAEIVKVLETMPNDLRRMVCDEACKIERNRGGQVGPYKELMDNSPSARSMDEMIQNLLTPPSDYPAQQTDPAAPDGDKKNEDDKKNQ